MGGAVRSLARTWQMEDRGRERVDRIRLAGEPIVFVLWHHSIVPLAWRHRGEGVMLLISRHHDGDLLAGLAPAWGYLLARGSSTRYGTEALRRLVRTVESGGDVAMTPDGPLGPPRVAKPGAVVTAQCTGAPIVPVGVSVERAWHVGSWDRMMVPKPLSTVRFSYGEPFAVRRGRAARVQATRQLTERLLRTEQDAQ